MVAHNNQLANEHFRKSSWQVNSSFNSSVVIVRGVLCRIRMWRGRLSKPRRFRKQDSANAKVEMKD